MDRARDPGCSICAQILFPGVSGSLGGFQGFAGGGAGARKGVRGRAGGAAQRLSVHDCVRCRRNREDLPGTRVGLAAGQPADVRRIEHLVLGSALFPAATGGRVSGAGQPCGENCHVRAQNRRGASGQIAEPRTGAIGSTGFFAGQARHGPEQLEFPAGGGQFPNAAEPRGLVVYLGAQEFQGQGCAVPAGGGAAGQPNRKHAGIPAGAGSVVAGLQEPAFEKRPIRNHCDRAVHFIAGGSSVAWHFSNQAGQDEVGRRNKNWPVRGGAVFPDAVQPMGFLPRRV